MHEFMNITKALADQNRVRLLLALEGKELCVCQLVEMLGLAPSTVSKHISVLRNARLVECHKEGLWVYYALPENPDKEIRDVLSWVSSSLSDDEIINKDCQKLRKIIKMDISKICKKQNRRNCC